MPVGGIAAVRKAFADNAKERLGMRKQGKGPTKEELELEEIKRTDLQLIRDFDIYENTSEKLRFRKYPWPFWFLGFAFASGASYLWYLSYTNVIKFKGDLQEVLILSFLAIMALVFLISGKIKSTVFDKSQNKLQIRKRNICCHRRSITVYKLSDIVDARVVWRGMKADAIDTLHYSILIEFDNSQKDTQDTTESDEKHHSTDDEKDKFLLHLDETAQKNIERQRRAKDIILQKYQIKDQVSEMIEQEREKIEEKC